MLKTFFSLLFIVSVFFPHALLAQNAPSSNKKRPKIGLALSGGASKGMAHLGVLEVLEKNGIPIDYISGTSMGAIIGGLYATGYPIDTLIKIARTIPWNEMYFDEVSRNQKFVDQRFNDEKFVLSLPIVDNSIGVPDGLINGQRFYNELHYYTSPVHQITNFDKLPIPFRAVATDLSTGKAFVFKEGSLALAIRASMSVPSVLKTVNYDGKRLIDGGIARNLPAQDALDMGADYVIGVDVGAPPPMAKELKNLFDILDQTISLQTHKNLKEQYDLSDLIIKPEVGEYGATDFDSLEVYIDRGRKAAESLLPEIIELVGKENLRTKPRKPLAIPIEKNSFLIHRISVDGISSDLSESVVKLLTCKTGKQTTLHIIKNDIDRLVGLGMFENVSYKLIPSIDSSFDLRIQLTEKRSEEFNLGVRYDHFYKASIMLNMLLRDRFIRSSELNATLRVGEEYFAELYYRKLNMVPPRFSMSFRTTYSHLTIPIFENYSRVAELGFNRANVSIELNTTRLFNLTTLLRLKTEYIYSLEKFGVNPTSNESFLNTVLYRVTYDNLPTLYYPNRGTFVELGIEHSGKYSISNYEFTQLSGTIKQMIPVTSFITWDIGLNSGISLSDDLPVHYNFMAGGTFPSVLNAEHELDFWGYLNRQIYQNQLHKASTALHFKVYKKNYVSLMANYGLINNTFSTQLTDYTELWGYGVMLGSLTPLGPVQLSFTTGKVVTYILALNVGFRF
ncbi:hypothetical protein EP331_10670 [bacterium]|nr:MAG: hypothetical protein EP331_10670 [bacterium]